MHAAELRDFAQYCNTYTGENPGFVPWKQSSSNV
jgi:hypothetical protein